MQMVRCIALWTMVVKSFTQYMQFTPQKKMSASKKGTERPVYRHLDAIGWDNVEIILVESFRCSRIGSPRKILDWPQRPETENQTGVADVDRRFCRCWQMKANDLQALSKNLCWSWDGGERRRTSKRSFCLVTCQDSSSSSLARNRMISYIYYCYYYY